MRKIFYLNLFILLPFIFFVATKSYARSLKLRLCSDENPQYPALFKEGKEIKGLHADIMNEVVKELKDKVHIQLNYNFMPWNRCLEELRRGTMDAALTASYKSDRAEFLNYPPGADDEKIPCSSPLKIFCNEHLVLTHKKESFIYDGNPIHLPLPVRAARGYSVVTDLEKAGIKALVLKSELNGIQQLAKDENGCALVTGIVAQEIIMQNEFKRIIEIQEKPFVQKSYFVPFSKRTPISPEYQDLIWKKIGEIGNDKKKIHSIYEQYTR